MRQTTPPTVPVLAFGVEPGFLLLDEGNTTWRVHTAGQHPERLGHWIITGENGEIRVYDITRDWVRRVIEPSRAGLTG